MKFMRMILVLGAAAGLSACASLEPATRNSVAAVSPALTGQSQFTVAASANGAAAVQATPYNVVRVDVVVPETLKVSDANSYFPLADIVWREDPPGDRYQQVKAIIQDAADQAVTTMNEGRPVIVEMQLTRFHALTEKTRYTIGGTHDIRFFLTVFDAASGAVLEPTRKEHLEFRAYGGVRALDAMRRGETQKVRINAHLIDFLRAELARRSAPAAAAGAPISLSAL